MEQPKHIEREEMMCFHVISFKAALGKKFIPKYFTLAGELEKTVVPLKTLTYLRK